ncbi:MAG: hypothetical protein ABIL66_10185, partial [candidate division WOR-3 bacterium]
TKDMNLKVLILILLFEANVSIDPRHCASLSSVFMCGKPHRYKTYLRPNRPAFVSPEGLNKNLE